MLLKYSSSQLQKRSKLAASGKPGRSTGSIKTVNGKGHRKGIRGVANKRIKAIAARREEVFPLPVDPCDNSNDSGLGFDHHLDFQVPRTAPTSFTEQEYYWPGVEAKRQRVDIKLESDNATDTFTFPHNPRVAPPTSSPPTANPRTEKTLPSGKGLKRGTQAGVGSNVGLSRDGKVQLVIVSQPENQHRARYQTEGSRGAVKDRTGNGFPIVKLVGYDKPAILEVYIGTDQGRETPHMFYQACRVSGKNSTPCVEKNVNGTVLIEIEFDPSKDMTVTCDCVGILKERNVDVEHRFPEESTARNKKKSTRCRMVFRTVITHSDNTLETLQVTSQPIICTQPPGVPEICKKSVVSCHSAGGLELFILGKNFLKDTRVIFSEGDMNAENYWEEVVQPDKEFLQQSHLVCTIPPYKVEDIKEPVVVKLNVMSSGRSSEAHNFLYTPLGTPPLQALPREPLVAARAALAQCVNQPPVSFPPRNLLLGIPLIQLGSHSSLPTASYIQPDNSKCTDDSNVHPVMLMPPPPAVLSPVRRPSQTMGTILEEHVELKREVPSPPTETVTPDLSINQTPSMATIRQFVSSTPLPALSVENYLSKFETNTDTSQKQFVEQSTREQIQIASLENQIAVSMANQAQVVSKLKAFAKSNAESQLSPSGGSVTSNLPDSSDSELVLGSIGLPQQTSPLNLNTHENIATTLNSSQMVTMESKILSPPPANLCNLLSEASQSQQLPMSTQILDSSLARESTGELMLNSSFSPGKKIMVTENMDIDVNQMNTSPSFAEISGSSTTPTSASDLLMNVVDDLSQSSQFSSSVIHTSLENSSQNSTMQPSVMVSSGFVSHDQVPELMSTSSNSFISPQPIMMEQKEVIQTELQNLTNQAHFQTSIMSACVAEPAQHITSTERNNVMEVVPSSSTETAMIVNKDVTFSGAEGMVMDTHFSPPVMNTSLSLPMSDPVKALTTEVDSAFSNGMVYSSAQKLPVVSSEPMSLGSSFGEVSSVSVEQTNQFVPTTFSSLTQQQNTAPQTTIESSIMNGGTIVSVKSEASLGPEGGNAESNITGSSYHQNITLVDSFTSHSVTVASGFIKVSSANAITAPVPSNKESSGVGNKTAVVTTGPGVPQAKKCEEGIPLPQELTQMSETDLLSYINPSCFDTV
uniref:Nuclear factor of activated T-cells 5 n=2 Tax=Lygus hesperus TaxID=30085 RepID=A0A0K8SLM1_LYGHE